MSGAVALLGFRKAGTETVKVGPGAFGDGVGAVLVGLTGREVSPGSAGEAGQAFASLHIVTPDDVRAGTSSPIVKTIEMTLPEGMRREHGVLDQFASVSDAVEAQAQITIDGIFGR